MEKIKKYIITGLICISLISVGYRLPKSVQSIPVDTEDIITLNGTVFVSIGLGDFNKMTVLDNIKNEMGIKVNFNQIGNSVEESQKKYILQLEEMPDFIMGGELKNLDILKYVMSERIIPLDELIEQYAPNIKKLLEENSFLKSACTFINGKIYTLPFYNETDSVLVDNYLFINKTWLDELGLQIPTTTDEFYDVLCAFKTRDPNGNGKTDEIPFSYIEDIAKYSANSFIGSFGVINSDKMLMVQDKKVLFAPAQEGYKEAILYLKKLYQEGLLDTEIFTQDIEQYIEKGRQETPVLGAFLAKDSTLIVGDERGITDYVVVPPLKGPGGVQLWGKRSSKIIENQFMITSKNAYPEITMAWIDKFFSQEYVQQIAWGAEGVTIEKKGGNYKFIQPPDKKSYTEHIMENSPRGACPGIFTQEMEGKFIFNPMLSRNTLYYDQYSPYLIEDNLCRRTMFITDFMGMDKFYSSLKKYTSEMKIRWISGEYRIEKEWERYLDALDSMGVGAYVIFYQEKYNECIQQGEHIID